MTRTSTPSGSPGEDELHAYLDGELPPERRQWIDAWLREHPEAAAELEIWRRDARRLRALHANPDASPENPALDPVAIRRRQHQRQTRRFAVAAMLLLALGLGSVAGWQLNDMHEPPRPLAMADALTAYRLFAATPADASSTPASLASPVNGPDHDSLTRLFDAHFTDGIRPPDLSAAGLTLTDARLLATDQGPAAMVIYRDAQGRQTMMYIRPPGPGHHMLAPGQRLDGSLMAQYFSRGDYNYAVISQADDPNADLLEQRLRQS